MSDNASPAQDPGVEPADAVTEHLPKTGQTPSQVDSDEPETLVVAPPESGSSVDDVEIAQPREPYAEDPPVASIPIIRDDTPAASPKAADPATAPKPEPEPNDPELDEKPEEPPTDSTPENPPKPADESPTRQSWKRLARMGAPRFTRANMVVSALTVVLGFALSTQISHTQTQGLESLRPSDLVGILDTVTQRSQRLGAELQELERVRDAMTSGQSGTEAAVRDAQQQVDTLGILNGTTQAMGPGVSITVKDPARKLTSALLLDLVQELRDAGAEAIQMGNQRVVASTYFADQPGGGMVVNGVPVSLPLTVIAIGDSHTLKSALSIPGGVVETARQQGGSVEAQTLERVHVTAVRNLPTPNHARPATSPS